MKTNNTNKIITYSDKYLSDPDDKMYGLWWLTEVWQKRSGLPMRIWAQTKVDNVLQPQFQVQSNHKNAVDIDSFVPVTLSLNPQIIRYELDPKDFDLVKQFVKLNYESFWKLWNGIYCSGDFGLSLKKI